MTIMTLLLRCWYFGLINYFSPYTGSQLEYMLGKRGKIVQSKIKAININKTLNLIIELLIFKFLSLPKSNITRTVKMKKKM